MNEFRRGFTLIELLVVISIIALLSTIVLASLSSARAKARDVERMEELRQVNIVLEMYANANNGRYPSTGGIDNVYMDPGCTQSVTAPDVKTANWIPSLVPNYTASLPRDPNPGSGKCYMYSSNGVNFILTAYGSVEGPSNGGRMNSNFGYRETANMNEPRCIYSTNYSFLDVVKRKSFTITNLIPSDSTSTFCETLSL